MKNSFSFLFRQIISHKQFMIYMVNEMRIYYIFKIKNDVKDVYEDTPSVIYNFLRNIYLTKDKDIDHIKMIYLQVINTFNKRDLDLKLYVKLHNKMKYSKKGDTHIINDIFKDEISIMRIKNSYIVINTNKNFTDFFKIINELSQDCFVCDFINDDYFFLRKIKMLV